MTCQCGEIQQDMRQVPYRRSRVDLSPQHRQCTIQHHEYHKRGQDTSKTMAVKLSHRLSFLHRGKQVGRYNHKQRNSHPRKSVIDGYPQPVGFRSKIRLRACHVCRPGCTVIIFTRMYEHDQKACEDAYIIQENNTFHFNTFFS